MFQVRRHGPRDTPRRTRPRSADSPTTASLGTEPVDAAQGKVSAPDDAPAAARATTADLVGRPLEHLDDPVSRDTREAGAEAEPAMRPSLARAHGVTGGLLGLIGRWDPGDLDDTDRARITASLFHEGYRFGPFARRFAALMTMSVLIAVMGLLADSTAVVIGAMLVAPLMTPVLGISAALVMGWPNRVLRQVVISAVGAAGAVGLAALTALAFPGSVDPLPGELVARTSPNLLDLGIALAAGAAGAYAQIRRAASDALTGVAVAVALVPPLAVVGITLALGELSLATGALLLFLANVAGIVMAAAVTFLICGLVPGGRLLAGSGVIAGGMRWAAVAVIVMVLPLHFTRGHVLPATDPSEAVEIVVDRFVEDASWSAEVVEVATERGDDGLVVEIVITDSPLMPDAEDVAAHLADELGETVAVTMQVVQVETDRATVDEEEVQE